MSSQAADRTDLLERLRREMQEISTLSVLFSQAIADRVGIHPTDLECLGILYASGPLTAGTLAEMTGLTTGAITGLVDRLEKRGFVRRERDASDRRRVFVHPLPAGGATIAPYFAPMVLAMNELFARYSADELALILDFSVRANEVTRDQIALVRATAPPVGMA